MDLERLIASFERITGKSFGEVPMSPILSSDSRDGVAATAKRLALLETWAAWWEWNPK